MSFNTTHQDFISLFPLLMSSCWPDGSPVVWRHFPNDPRKMCSGFFFFFPMNSWECNLPSWVEQFKSPNPAKLWIEILSLLNYRHLWKEKQTFSSLPQIECSSISEYSERIIKSNHLDSGKSYSTLRWQAESLSDSIIDTILQLNVQRKSYMVIKRVDQWFQPGCCGRSWPVWNYPILFSEKNNNGRSFSVVDFLFVYSYMPATFSTLLWKAEEIRNHFCNHFVKYRGSHVIKTGLRINPQNVQTEKPKAVLSYSLKGQSFTRALVKLQLVHTFP